VTDTPRYPNIDHKHHLRQKLPRIRQHSWLSEAVAEDAAATATHHAAADVAAQAHVEATEMVRVVADERITKAGETATKAAKAVADVVGIKAAVAEVAVDRRRWRSAHRHRARVSFRASICESLDYPKTFPDRRNHRGACLSSTA